MKKVLIADKLNTEKGSDMDLQNTVPAAEFDGDDSDRTVITGGETANTTGKPDNGEIVNSDIVRLTAKNDAAQGDSQAEIAEIVRLKLENEGYAAEIVRLELENEALAAENKRLTLKCGEYSEFAALFPGVDVDTLPEEVLADSGRGIVLAAAYALWLHKQQLHEREAAAANSINRERSAGPSPSGGEPTLYSAEQIRRMSAAEVQRNYSRVMASMNPAFEEKH